MVAVSPVRVTHISPRLNRYLPLSWITNSSSFQYLTAPSTSRLLRRHAITVLISYFAFGSHTSRWEGIIFTAAPLFPSTFEVLYLYRSFESASGATLVRRVKKRRNNSPDQKRPSKIVDKGGEVESRRSKRPRFSSAIRKYNRFGSVLWCSDWQRL